MGGPFWAGKDQHAWSIFKGEYGDDEDPQKAACREFQEETGFAIPAGELVSLGQIRQAGGKQVTAWAIAADLDPAAIKSNTFTLEWPPRSGREATFPEIDRAAWFELSIARRKIVEAQATFLDVLSELTNSGGTP